MTRLVQSKSSSFGGSPIASVSFHWRRDAISQRLLLAVGSIMLDWSMIDHEITKMVEMFSRAEGSDERIPRDFKKRSPLLRGFTDKLYADEQDEWLIFRWYLQRVRQASRKRADIAHGMPGTITKGRRTYEGLMVPFPSKTPDYVPMTMPQIVGLANELRSLLDETILVSSAVGIAHIAASPQKSFSQVDGVWTQLTRDNRSPRLPRDHPPPLTFRG